MKKIEVVSRNELENRLYACLSDRKLPDYFLYLDEAGTDGWLTLDKAPGFPVAQRLTDLLRDSLPSLSGHIACVRSLVSIGVGSGQKERLLLQSFPEKAVPAYYPVDVSSEMVDEALESAADIPGEKTGIVGLLEDLQHVRSHWNKPALVCMLGNTFCNYAPWFALSIMNGVLDDSDLFLFDSHLLHDSSGSREAQESIERAYRVPENVAFNTGPVVRRGMLPENCTFSIKLVAEQKAGRVTYRTRKVLRVEKDSEVSCNGQVVRFRAGEEIRMGFTYKYTADQLVDIVERQRMDVVTVCHDHRREYMLILARKKHERKDI